MQGNRRGGGDGGCSRLAIGNLLELLFFLFFSVLFLTRHKLILHLFPIFLLGHPMTSDVQSKNITTVNNSNTCTDKLLLIII